MLSTLRRPPRSGQVRQLVVLCHGLGADGQDLIDLAHAWSPALPDALFAAPDGPQPCDMAPHGRQWFSLAVRAPGPIEAGVRAAALELDPFIDAELSRAGLPPDAYALMGFSQGAMTVLFAGLRRPVAPRCILAFSGMLVAPGKLSEIANRAPVLLAHGEADEVVPASRSREAAAALAAAGVPVETSFTRGMGHGLSEAGIAQAALMLQRVFAPPV
jgi:phospholipase/carboxylesterase